MKKRILAMPEAAPAMPENPSNPARRAMIRNVIIQDNIVGFGLGLALLNVAETGYIFGCSASIRRCSKRWRRAIARRSMACKSCRSSISNNISAAFRAVPYSITCVWVIWRATFRYWHSSVVELPFRDKLEVGGRVSCATPVSSGVGAVALRSWHALLVSWTNSREA